jgi:hypothetical protein
VKVMNSRLAGAELKLRGHQSRESQARLNLRTAVARLGRALRRALFPAARLVGASDRKSDITPPPFSAVATAIVAR